MSIDRTLKVHGGLLRSRSVLSRAERIAQLIDEGKFDPEEDSPLGLPKVRVRHSRAGMKSKKAGEEPKAEGEAAAEAAEQPAAKPAEADKTE
jgi:small basic protein (TIGR04137 family)